MEEDEDIQLRISGDASQPTLIYLPGLHGDWTLLGNFRIELGERVRFVEITYPRTLRWTLHDYAERVEQALDRHGIADGWVLAESFGSQVSWALLERGVFRPSGLVLAGGFVRHPARWAVRLASFFGGTIPLRLITTILFGYAKLARFQYRDRPEVTAGISEFIARRTELDRKAAVHRLQLIFGNNPCAIAQKANLPLYAITGMIDPIVPWIPVRSWLRRNCDALREYRVVKGADHNILGTAAKTSADQIVCWIKSSERCLSGNAQH